LSDADDRPLNRRDLMSELGSACVHDSIDDYRQAVDRRLFGLGAARYDQLLDLVLTLRRPQLAKDLNPVELSRTLQGGLRPVDDALIIEAARSFDDMEAVARTLEGLIAADEATTSFLSIYSTYLRTHARATVDTLTGRLAECARRQAAIEEFVTAEATARLRSQEAVAELGAAEGEPGRLRAHLDALRASAAYQSQEQLAGVRQHVTDLATEAARAAAAATRVASAARSRRDELRRAALAVDETTTELARLARDLAEAAEAAGVVWTAADFAAEDAATRSRGRVTARRDDVRVVREQVDRVARAEREHTRIAAELESARAAVTQAEAELTGAETECDDARRQTKALLATWADDHRTVLAELATPEMAERLDRAVDAVGLDDTPTPRDVVLHAGADGLARVRAEAADLAHRRRELTGRRDEVATERDRIAAERDDAPPSPPTRPADRTQRPGGPLWRLVDFAPAVAAEQAATLEAALMAAGLLDAWVHPDPTAPWEWDGYLRPLPEAERPRGRTLATSSCPSKDPACRRKWYGPCSPPSVSTSRSTRHATRPSTPTGGTRSVCSSEPSASPRPSTSGRRPGPPVGRRGSPSVSASSPTSVPNSVRSTNWSGAMRASGRPSTQPSRRCRP
jgi:hypothetical protein